MLRRDKDTRTSSTAASHTTWQADSTGPVREDEAMKIVRVPEAVEPGDRRDAVEASLEIKLPAAAVGRYFPADRAGGAFRAHLEVDGRANAAST